MSAEQHESIPDNTNANRELLAAKVANRWNLEELRDFARTKLEDDYRQSDDAFTDDWEAEFASNPPDEPKFN